MNQAPQKFRKKPVVIEAVQLTWANWGLICEFVGVGSLKEGKPMGSYLDENDKPIPDANGKLGLLIPTLEGLMVAKEGDYIIKGIKGEFYPCRSDIFDATYEAVP